MNDQNFFVGLLQGSNNVEQLVRWIRKIMWTHVTKALYLHNPLFVVPCPLF